MVTVMVMLQLRRSGLGLPGKGRRRQAGGPSQASKQACVVFLSILADEGRALLASASASASAFCLWAGRRMNAMSVR